MRNQTYCSVHGYQCGVASCSTLISCFFSNFKMSSHLGSENVVCHVNIAWWFYSQSISVVLKDVGSHNPKQQNCIPHFNHITVSCSSWGWCSTNTGSFFVYIPIKVKWALSLMKTQTPWSGLVTWYCIDTGSIVYQCWWTVEGNNALCSWHQFSLSNTSSFITNSTAFKMVTSTHECSLAIVSFRLIGHQFKILDWYPFVCMNIAGGFAKHWIMYWNFRLCVLSCPCVAYAANKVSDQQRGVLQWPVSFHMVFNHCLLIWVLRCICKTVESDH